MKPVTRIATLILALVAIAHFLRLVLVSSDCRWRENFLWVSGLACVVTGELAGLLWRERRR